MDFDPPHDNVKQHAASGFVFSAMSQGVRIFTQFLSVVIMARLLNPEDFGLVAKISPIYAFALLFHDLGLSQATMQRPKLTSQQVNTFFWINGATGFVLTLCIITSSPLVALFYHDDRAQYLTIAMALLVMIGGLGNQHGALMQRRMAFREQASINITGSIASLLAAVAWGAMFHNYWALYAGMVAGTLLPTIGVWLVIKWRPSFPKAAAETKEMLKYGLGITGGNFVNFITGNISNVIIGRVLGDRLLGFYDRASRLVYAPLQQLIFPISGVVVPILYRLHDDEDRYRRTFLRAVGTLFLAIIPGIIWIVAAARIAVPTLLGPKWPDAAPVFAALSFAALPQLINSAGYWLIMTQGRSKDYAHWTLINALASIAALVIGLPFGIIGIASSTVAVQLILTPFFWRFACRVGPIKARQVFGTLLPQLAGALTAVPLLILLQRTWGPSYPLLLLIVGGCSSYGIVLAVVLLFPAGRESVKRDMGFVRFMLLRILLPKPQDKMG